MRKKVMVNHDRINARKQPDGHLTMKVGVFIVRCVQYLAMVAAMGTAVFCLLAGICCLCLEEYRQQNRYQESALESHARKQAEKILDIYLVQGMEEAHAYAEAENVNYVIQKVSGRRLGGNYRAEDTQTILKLNGKTLQYTYELPEEIQGEDNTYIIKIAYLEMKQIQKIPIHLEGLPDDLRIWTHSFFVAAGVALAATVAILGYIIHSAWRSGQKASTKIKGKKPLIKLLLWWVAVALTGLWGCGLPQVWNIPVTWENGAAPMLAQLGQSIRDMTFCGLLLGILVSGFFLHLFCYRIIGRRAQSSPLQKLCGKLLQVLERLSWFQKALLVLLLVCTLEALLLGLAQYKVLHGEGMEGLQNWLVTGRGSWMVWGLWSLEKIMLALLVLRTAHGMMRLRTSGRELAKGNLGYQIPLEGMKGEALQFGRDLNAISQVVADAVEDRMKSERLKTELITNVSHDIKTPLTSIINYADLISREPSDNERISEYAQVLHRQSTRLKKLIEDLMEVSRASTGNLEVYLERCQAGVLLSQVMGEFEQRLQERGIDLIIRQCPEPVWIMADPRMLWRILDNLMTNICKYAQSNTRVYLSLETSRTENLNAETSDTKSSILSDSNVTTQEEQALLIFKNISSHPLDMDASELMERFVREDKSRHTEGNGLGLAIARSLTELQGGSMLLTTDGDLFKVTLIFPVVRETEHDPFFDMY